MKLKERPTTSTPSANTQAALRVGGIRQACLRFPTAVVIGTAAIGGHSFGSDAATATAVGSVNCRLIDLLSGSDSPGHRLPYSEELSDLGTDDLIPAELRAYLESSLPVEPPQASEVQAETDYDLNARLAPPPMREHRVRVRFKFIGKESARIRTEADSE